jgi:hypothetical protein
MLSRGTAAAYPHVDCTTASSDAAECSQVTDTSGGVRGQMLVGVNPAFRDDTGESFAAITWPDIVLSGSVFAAG